MKVVFYDLPRGLILWVWKRKTTNDTIPEIQVKKFVCVGGGEQGGGGKVEKMIQIWL